MSTLSKKILLASILAIALALSLVGATYYFPSGQASKSIPILPTAPVPSTAPIPSSSSSAASSTAATPIPAPIPSTAPSTASPVVPAPTAPPVPASATGELSNLVPELSVAAAIVIAIVAVLLLFSERDLKLKNSS